MESIRTSKEILKNWFEKNMIRDPRTDRTRAKYETINEYASIDVLVDCLYEYLEDNHWRC